MELTDIKINISKAVNNAYLNELQYKTHNTDIQNIIKKTNVQTSVDKTIKDFFIKF